MKNNCSREQKPKKGPLQKLRETHKKANRGVKRGGDSVQKKQKCSKNCSKKCSDVL